MLLCGSLLLESSFLPHGIENDQLLQYSHAYKLSDCANIKTIDTRAYVLQDGVKMETFAPQNDYRTKRNVNFY